MKYDYWVYASPGVDPNVPAALMVWQDGQTVDGEWSTYRLVTHTVTENLVQQGLYAADGSRDDRLPALRRTDGAAMRSIEYDTVSDHYARFLMEEVLPEVEQTDKLRQDRFQPGHRGDFVGRNLRVQRSMAHARQICARTLRVMSSFTSIKWRPRGETRRRQRVPLFGAQGSEAEYPGVGERWSGRPGEQLRILAHAGYPDGELAEAARFDFPFRFGTAARRRADFLDLPESLAWLAAGLPIQRRLRRTLRWMRRKKEQPFFRVTQYESAGVVRAGG